MRWNRSEAKMPAMRMSKVHLDFGLRTDELAPTQRTLVDQIEFHNDGKRALLIATPIISSPSFTLSFAPGVLTVPPKSSGIVSVALTLTRPTSIYELVDMIVCDLATVFVTIVLDSKLQSDIDPKALRFGVQKSRFEHSRTYEALYAGYKCAVKVMHDADEFRTEDALLRSVPEHRTLLKFIGSCEVGATGFEPYCGMIVTELVEYGSLGDIVHNVLRSISFRLYLRIATDIATALAYLHDGGFVHGALRPSNVMLLSLSARAECVAKLQDYGAAPHERLSAMQARAERGGGGGDRVRSLQPEIMLYSAPEALADPPHYNAASDVFAFGLVLFESFARQLPYLGADSPYDVTVAKRARARRRARRCLARPRRSRGSSRAASRRGRASARRSRASARTLRSWWRRPRAARSSSIRCCPTTARQSTSRRRTAR
jgi:serine/threonine protein kinase